MPAQQQQQQNIFSRVAALFSHKPSLWVRGLDAAAAKERCDISTGVASIKFCMNQMNTVTVFRKGNLLVKEGVANQGLRDDMQGIVMYYRVGHVEFLAVVYRYRFLLPTPAMLRRYSKHMI